MEAMHAHQIAGSRSNYIATQPIRRSAATDAAPTVFVVDDDISARKALELLIRSAGWQARSFVSAEEFLSHHPSGSPSCLVLGLTAGLSGLALQKQLVGQAALPIIFVSGEVDVPMAVEAMKAGAVEVLTKPINDAALLNAIDSAVEKSRAAICRHSELRTLQARYATLTSREREVMALVVSGLLNKQVGGELGISEVTVKAHRGQAMRKMNAKSLPELVTIALRLGLH